MKHVMILMLIIQLPWRLFGHSNAPFIDSMPIGFTYLGDKMGNNKSDTGIVWILVSPFPFTSLEMEQSGNLYKRKFYCKIGKKYEIIVPVTQFRNYMYISCKNVSPKKIFGSFYYIDNVYLLNRDDKINCNIYDEEVSFSGQGAEKLNCESEIYKNRIAYGEKYSKLCREGKFTEALRWQAFALDSCLSVQLNILKRYEKLMSGIDYETLKINCCAQRYYNLFRDIRLSIFGNWQGAREIYQYYVKSYRDTNFYWKAHDKNSLVNSPIYTSMLVEKLRLDMELKKFNWTSNYDRPTFENYFNLINANYSGKLKDKLLGLLFISLSNSKPDALSCLNKGLFLMSRKSLYRSLLENKIPEKRGNALRNFNLEDSSKVHFTLDSFKNKVLLLDFWYTGCENCIKLKKAMEPVFTHFRNDKDVLFISISIDKNRENWKKSLRRGRYTDPIAINLYTSGMADAHPLISNYQISSYPKQMIVVNKKIYEFNPPVPILNPITESADTSGNTVKLIDILERAKKDLAYY